MTRVLLSPLDGIDGNATDPLELRRNWQVLEDARLPRVVSQRLSYSQLGAGSTASTAVLGGVPPGTVVLGAKVKHAEAFSGGGVTSYDVDVGIAGDLTRFISGFDAAQAVGSTAFAVSAALFDGLAHDADTDIIVRATANVDTNNATAGKLDVWLLIGVIA